jgi:hypothetical protein
MAKATKRGAKQKISSTRRKASNRPTSKKNAKRKTAKHSMDHGRIVTLTARLDQMLWSANSTRRKVMSRETLASLLRVIIGGEELAWARSSSLNSGMGSGRDATFALCARTSPSELHIAIACGFERRGSPGHAWPDLKPWRPNTRKTAEKLKRWLDADANDLIRLSNKEADSVASKLTKLPPPKTRWHHLDTSGNEIIIVRNLAKSQAKAAPETLRRGEPPLGNLTSEEQSWLANAYANLNRVYENRMAGGPGTEAFCIFAVGKVYVQFRARWKAKKLLCEAVSTKFIPELAAVLMPKGDEGLREFGFAPSEISPNYSQIIEIKSTEDLGYAARLAFRVLKQVYCVADFGLATFKDHIPSDVAISPSHEIIEPSASRETAHDLFIKAISGNPRFQKAAPSGKGFVIGGAKPPSKT